MKRSQGVRSSRYQKHYLVSKTRKVRAKPKSSDFGNFADFGNLDPESRVFLIRHRSEQRAAKKQRISYHFVRFTSV